MPTGSTPVLGGTWHSHHPSERQSNMHTMIRKADPRTHESPEATQLRELENVIQQMWAVEPDCRFGERHAMLNTLRQLSIDVERLSFRASFHADEPHDADEFQACVARTCRLARNWSDSLWSATAWPAGVLGDDARTSVGNTS
jgi:hypothetical protein